VAIQWAIQWLHSGYPLATQWAIQWLHSGLYNGYTTGYPVATQRAIQWLHNGLSSDYTTGYPVATQRAIQWLHNGLSSDYTTGYPVATQRAMQWLHNGLSRGYTARSPARYAARYRPSSLCDVVGQLVEPACLSCGSLRLARLVGALCGHSLVRFADGNTDAGVPASQPEHRSRQVTRLIEIERYNHRCGVKASGRSHAPRRTHLRSKTHAAHLPLHKCPPRAVVYSRTAQQRISVAIFEQASPANAPLADGALSRIRRETHMPAQHLHARSAGSKEHTEFARTKQAIRHLYSDDSSPRIEATTPSSALHQPRMQF
jgi:hypothetical protein